MSQATVRNSLTVQPHLYMGDSTGRPLDYGMVYFGEVDKDPEFYPINIFYDEALTLAASQPVRTKGGFLNANGDMVEIYANEVEYSVKVLDSYGRKIFYEGKIARASLDDLIITENGMTQRQVNSIKLSKVAELGRPDVDVLYRLGTNYESRAVTAETANWSPQQDGWNLGIVQKSESRTWFHDYRPTMADGADFNTDGCNFFLGQGAGNFTMKPNVNAIGDYKLHTSHNYGIGLQSLGKLTTGYKNTTLGTNTGRALTEGYYNTAVGRDAMHNCTIGNSNVMMGMTAGYGVVSGNYNVHIGTQSGYNNIDGSGNCYLGARSGNEMATGDNNTFVGYQSGRDQVSGIRNTHVGYQNTGNGITTGSYNTTLGCFITGLDNASNQTVISDGLGNKVLYNNPNGTKPATLDITGRDATTYSATATDGQIGVGTTFKLRNTSNSSSFSQILMQSRAGQAITRIVQWGSASPKLSIVHGGVEAVRVETNGSVNIKSAAAGTTDLNSNGMVGFELVSNTQLAVKVRGNDGVTRTATLTLT